MRDDVGFNYYDLLGVAQTATVAEIKQAYRAAVSRYHPDVNPAANATQLTAMLNAAWATLSDPARRAAYDAATAYETTRDASVADSSTSPAEWELVACMRCGQSDATLRAVAFMFVVSLVIVSWRIPRAGIFCAKCRSTLSWQTALGTMFLGWWSFWGFFWSIQSLYYSIIGGAGDRDVNGNLLVHLGGAFWQRGRLDEAITCFIEGNRTLKDARVTSAISELEQVGASAPKRVRFTAGQWFALAIAALPIMAIFAWVALSSESDVSSPSSSTATTYSLEQRAQAGDSKAELDLANEYYTGHNRAQDIGEAVRWYTSAAKSGNADAESSLAFIYLMGLAGVTKDEPKGVQWLEQAALRGDPQAQYILSIGYEQGRWGLTQSTSTAIDWLNKSAAQGFARAEEGLGDAYMSGLGVGKDTSTALHWFRLAAAQNDPGGQASLGVLLWTGTGTAENDREGVDYLRKAADQGDASGQTFLSMAYFTGRGVQKDDISAYQWMSLAAMAGFGDSKNYLNRIASEMTSAQIDTAKQRASDWIAAHPDSEAATPVGNNPTPTSPTSLQSPPSSTTTGGGL